MSETNIPNPQSPVVDENGLISPSWYRFFSQFHGSFLNSGTNYGTGLILSGNQLAIAPNGVANAMLRKSVALSIIGQAANVVGTPQDIAAGASGQILQRDGSGLLFRYPKLPSFTVANLPSASTQGAGTMVFVTDANSTTFNAIVAGGGANGVRCTSDGTNWRIG